MNAFLKRFLFITPRGLAVLFALFVSIFALDVFGEGYSFWNTILAFLIHLVPTYILVIALLIAWKWEKIGGILFLLLGVFYFILGYGKFDFIGMLIMIGPLAIIGILFIISGIFKKSLKK